MTRPPLLWVVLANAIVAACGPLASARAEEGFFLRGGERIVFFGDSITQNGGYVAYVEAFLRTRLPEQRFEVVNHGISSETLSGTSEPDHDPRRPCAHDRFDRDVAAWKPDVLVACFGMNDGNYHPFDEERFAAYRQGVRRLIERCRQEAGDPRVVLLTPPPFDPYYRRAADPTATAYGYKFAAIDYDDVLARYSAWLVTLRDEGLAVADCHTPMNDLVRRRRQEQVSFTLSPDAVHPDATGHWLMARALLDAWQAPSDEAAEVDAASAQARRGEVRNVKRDGEAVSFVWTARLPAPVDPAWDRRTLELTHAPPSCALRVTGLRAGQYELLADGSSVVAASSEQLSEGVTLDEVAEFPPTARSREVLALVQERARLIYAAWRKTIAAPDDPAVQAEQQAADVRATELDAQLRELCRPMELHLTIKPAAR